MEPGRELDALIAEKVMGWQWVQAVDDWGQLRRFLAEPSDWRDYTPADMQTPLRASPLWDYEVPRYSKDIAAAWEVVERFDGYSLDHSQGYPYSCELWLEKRHVARITNGRTQAHAICLAALSAVGVEV